MAGRKLYRDAKSIARGKRYLRLARWFVIAWLAIPSAYITTLAVTELVKCGSIACLWGEKGELVRANLPTQPYAYIAVGLVFLVLYILLLLLLEWHTIKTIAGLVFLQIYLLAIAFFLWQVGNGVRVKNVQPDWLLGALIAPLLLWYMWNTPWLPERQAKDKTDIDGAP